MEQPGDGIEGKSTLPEVSGEAELKALTEEKERLAAENTELRDQLLRRRADFENFRKRMERERQHVTEYAAMDVVRELLPVLDHLERAIAASPQDAQDEFHAGVRIIAKQFLETMERFGLTPIEALGKPFDPNVHQAVDRVVTEEQPDNTVVEEWQRGYMFKDRLLRPAMVKVAVHP
jgi:molecular chaperone GrpE